MGSGSAKGGSGTPARRDPRHASNSRPAKGDRRSTAGGSETSFVPAKGGCTRRCSSHGFALSEQPWLPLNEGSCVLETTEDVHRGQEIRPALDVARERDVTIVTTMNLDRLPVYRKWVDGDVAG